MEVSDSISPIDELLFSFDCQIKNIRSKKRLLSQTSYVKENSEGFCPEKCFKFNKTEIDNSISYKRVGHAHVPCLYELLLTDVAAKH